jgi:hypothetical protein
MTNRTEQLQEIRIKAIAMIKDFPLLNWSRYCNLELELDYISSGLLTILDEEDDKLLRQLRNKFYFLTLTAWSLEREIDYECIKEFGKERMDLEANSRYQVSKIKEKEDVLLRDLETLIVKVVIELAMVTSERLRNQG